MNLTKHIRADRCFPVFLLLAIAAVFPLHGADSPSGLAELDLARKLNRAFVHVSEQVSSSVVVITVSHRPDYADPDDESSRFFDALPPEMRKRFEEYHNSEKPESRPRRRPMYDGNGSGFIIREDGYILTNGHVVDGADKIKVRLKNGKEYDALIQGVDGQSDLAVLKIPAQSLPAARMADSDRTMVGEFAIAIGAPFNLDYSVTFGHVSAKGRHVIPGDEGAAMDQDFIQTDANINPGNSGGPLVNIEGEVIGINTLIRGMRTGIGFAIPSNLAREISDKLIADGRFVRAWLGVGIRSLNEDAEMRDRVTIKQGVVITEIRKGGPASRSELRPADIITAVDGKPVATSLQLKNAIRSKAIGGTIVLDVFRPPTSSSSKEGKSMKINVNADEWPEEPVPMLVRNAAPSTPTVETKSLGLTVKALTRELADQFNVEEKEGVIVTEVERGSLGEEKGIRPGDIITSVDQKTVASPKEFRDVVREADLRKGVIVNLISRGSNRFEILKETGE
jgi:serine protease Do